MYQKNKNEAERPCKFVVAFGNDGTKDVADTNDAPSTKLGPWFDALVMSSTLYSNSLTSKQNILSDTIHQSHSIDHWRKTFPGLDWVLLSNKQTNKQTKLVRINPLASLTKP